MQVASVERVCCQPHRWVLYRISPTSKWCENLFQTCKIFHRFHIL